jgi:hypothetical protein
LLLFISLTKIGNCIQITQKNTPLKNKRGINDCLPLRSYSPVMATSNLLTGFDYFLVVSATGALVVSATGAGAGAGVSTFGESTAGVSAFFSSPLLQAAKATETIANAKITFFIF